MLSILNYLRSTMQILFFRTEHIIDLFYWEIFTNFFNDLFTLHKNKQISPVSQTHTTMRRWESVWSVPVSVMAVALDHSPLWVVADATPAEQCYWTERETRYY